MIPRRPASPWPADPEPEPNPYSGRPSALREYPSTGRSRTSSRQAIREGRYGEGDPLPSETALAESYGVTRMTARQAVDVLKNEGLVRSEHGRGVLVRTRPTVRRLARNRFTRAWRERGGTGRGAYDVEMRQLGLEPGVELAELGR